MNKVPSFDKVLEHGCYVDLSEESRLPIAPKIERLNIRREGNTLKFEGISEDKSQQIGIELNMSNKRATIDVTKDKGSRYTYDNKTFTGEIGQEFYYRLPTGTTVYHDQSKIAAKTVKKCAEIISKMQKVHEQRCAGNSIAAKIASAKSRP